MSASASAIISASQAIWCRLAASVSGSGVSPTLRFVVSMTDGIVASATGGQRFQSGFCPPVSPIQWLPIPLEIPGKLVRPGTVCHASERPRGSERAAVLAGAIDPQPDYVAGGLVTAGVGDDLVERPVASLAGQFAHAGMLANRPEARMLAQTFDAVPDRGQPPPSPRSRPGLGQPDCRFLKVGERLGCIYQFTVHPERQVRSTRPRMAWVGHRQRIAGAKAVDPRIHFGRGCVIAGSD